MERREKDELSGESYYSDNDLTGQLREKIRNQAQRLRALEQYRLLCEQRIQELFPGHSLPVKQEHLGSNVSLANELKMAKQKITRLEAQISQNLTGKDSETEVNDDGLHEKLELALRDKAEVEESLRAEMLNCEEQRAYIEVLKQAMEAKMLEHAGAVSESHLAFEVKETKPKNDESRREQAKIRNTLLDYESQIKRLQSQIQNKELEVEGLTAERDELDGHLRQAAEALQIAEEEVDKLEEEKTSLLEYVDEHSVKEQEMEKELNELGKYFEEMKADFEKTKKDLENERNNRGKFELESEVFNEEIYKSNKSVKDLQASLSSLKVLNEEKEAMVRNAKEEKINFEIRIESLQANAATLAETLKETQADMEELQKQLDQMKKQDIQKSENIQKLKGENYAFSLENSQIKETISDLKKDFEQEKKERLEIERMRELDIKQVQEFKSKLSQFKSKCESLEEDKKFRLELEHYRMLDAEKLAQVQEEFNYLQENYRETQQRELIQSEALNDLRQHNSELTREIEDLYRENQQISVEYAKKSQDLEVYLSKFGKINELCEELEGEKNRLERELRQEKNTGKALKDQSNYDKNKVEELYNSLQESTQSLEKLQRRVKDKEEESQYLKLQLKSIERDFDDEKYCRNKLLEEFEELASHLENKEKDLEKTQNEIVDCCKAVASFSGKYISSSHDFRSNISTGYKEFLYSWKDKIVPNMKMLLSWISNTSEEIDNLTHKISELSKESQASNYELSKLVLKLDGLNTGEVTCKQETSKIKSQLESTNKKYEAFREVSEKEINSLRLEVNSLKIELGRLNNENNDLQETLHRSLSENNELRLSTEMVRSSLKTHEDRVNLLKTEKNQLESLLVQVQRSLGSSEINKIYSEIARIRTELEVLERERLNLQCQLLKFEADPRGKDSELFKELNQKLVQCERQIRNFKKNMQILQDDAGKEEMVQKLRGDSKKTQNANFLHPRYTESPQSLRQKAL